MTGKMNPVGNLEFEYRGDLNWHQLVDKFLKLGFEQEPEFDKMCGSPSYQSEENNGFKLTVGVDNGGFTMVGTPMSGTENSNSEQTENNTDPSKFSDKPEGQVYVDVTEPTTLVIFGESPENYSTTSTPNNIQITDDETSYSVFVGGKRTHDYIGSMGFADVFTLEEYKKYYAEKIKMIAQDGGIGVQRTNGRVEDAITLAYRHIEQQNPGMDFRKVHDMAIKQVQADVAKAQQR